MWSVLPSSTSRRRVGFDEPRYGLEAQRWGAGAPQLDVPLGAVQPLALAARDRVLRVEVEDGGQPLTQAVHVAELGLLRQLQLALVVEPDRILAPAVAVAGGLDAPRAGLARPLCGLLAGDRLDGARYLNLGERRAVPVSVPGEHQLERHERVDPARE